jgi:hypothetical protein
LRWPGSMLVEPRRRNCRPQKHCGATPRAATRGGPRTLRSQASLSELTGSHEPDLRVVTLLGALGAGPQVGCGIRGSIATSRCVAACSCVRRAAVSRRASAASTGRCCAFPPCASTCSLPTQRRSDTNRRAGHRADRAFAPHTCACVPLIGCLVRFIPADRSLSLSDLRSARLSR